MNLLATKQILIFALTLALLGGVFYGGYRYWQSLQVVSESQESEELSGENIVAQHLNPQGEETYRIVKNEDGTQTYTSFIHKFRINAPVGWEIGDVGNPNAAVGASIAKEGSFYFTVRGFLKAESFASYKYMNTDGSRQLPDEQLFGILVEVYEEDDEESPYEGGHRMLFFNGGNGTYVAVTVAPLSFISESEYEQILNSIEFFD